MKTRTFTKRLIVNSDPTKESLKEALHKYNPKSISDFFVTCMLHVSAVKFAEKGYFDGPGTYELTDIWFSKRAPFHKVICQLRKIN